jgi:hypothetical protein
LFVSGGLVPLGFSDRRQVVTSVVETLAERSLSVYLTEGIRFELAAALAAIEQEQGIDAARAVAVKVDSGDFTATLTEDGRVLVSVDDAVLVDRPIWRLRVPAEFGLGDD